MAIKEAYTTRELVDLLSVSQQAIAKRASREGWQSRTRKGRGGGHEWLVDSMPESTVQAIKAAVATQEAEAVVADVVALEGHEKNAASAPACATVPDKNLAIARARHRLVREWRAYMERGKVKAISARELSTSFVIGYNSGILNLPDWVREIVKAVSEKTLYRWESTMNRQAGDLLALADRRGSWTRGGPKGLGQIGEEAESFFLKAYLQPTKPSLHLAWMASCSALERRGLAAPSYSSTLRFFQRYDSHNHDIVLWMREGNKALKDKVAPYLSRDSRILEVGDILVADGHKMNFMVINPETGKPCRMTLIGWQDWASGLFMAFEIMLSENTQAIAASLYRAIMSLGKIPRAVYIDNGEAFKNKFFENENSDMEEFDGLYLRLGIHVQHSLPYEARAKVIERWWGDFDRQAAVLMDSYVGNSIDNKPAYLKRNEKWLSERHSDYTPTVDDVKHLVTEYAKWKAAQPHPTRPGSTPWSVFSAGRGPGFSEGEKSRFGASIFVSPRSHAFALPHTDAWHGVRI